MVKFKSIALWPDSVNVGSSTTVNESSDTHDTREQAEAICARLRREGLGGMGVAFPVSTRVEEIALPNIRSLP